MAALCGWGWLVCYAGWHWGRALLLVIGLLLLVRGIYVASGFALAGVSPGARATPDLGWARGLGLFWREWWAFVRLYSFVQPLACLGFFRADGRGESPGAPLVLLVHGYTCNEGAWWRWGPYLRKAGFRVRALTLEPVFGSLDAYVGQLAGAIEALRGMDGGQTIALIGHSMGGLAIRAYLGQYGWAGIGQVVTLGAPHRGTKLAALGPGENARQMERDSAWLLGLAQAPNPPPGRALAIWSLHDNFVYPQFEQSWPGARAEPVEGLGHLEMLVNLPLMGKVATWLASRP